jgi:hypothetical protein
MKLPTGFSKGTNRLVLIRDQSMPGHSTSAWGIQLLREAIPYDSSSGYLICDRGSNSRSEADQKAPDFHIPEHPSWAS